MEPISWALLALAGLNAGLGYDQAQKQNKYLDEKRKVEKAASKWEGFTGRPGEVVGPDVNPLAAIVQGGLSGVGAAAELNKAGVFDKSTPSAPTQGGSNTSADYSNYFDELMKKSYLGSGR